MKKEGSMYHAITDSGVVHIVHTKKGENHAARDADIW